MTEEEKGILSIAGTEIIADYPAPWTIREEALVIPEGEEMNHLSELIFLRHEPNKALHWKNLPPFRCAALRQIVR